ncbi:MAG TPA: DUF5666 domain-containing protein [Ktedonobacteraceae bacterium]|nr:DUF5666 domain-containing protein [Ktedonobacteraceae bacterium]
MKKVFSLLPVVIFAALLAACGSSSTTTSNASSTGTPTTSTACLSVTTGMIQSVSNNTLQVTNLQGKNVQVTLSGTTILTRQATLTAADLKTGSPVTVIVKQNADNTYSALSVSVRATQARTGQGGFRNGVKVCGGQRRGNGTGGFSGPGFGAGTPGASNSGTSRQTINGTVSSLNGNALTVTDTSGNDFTVTLTTTTRMMQQQSLTIGDLQSGQAVTITGTANSQGVINASSVSLLQALPARRGTPTPTSTPASNA